MRGVVHLRPETLFSEAGKCDVVLRCPSKENDHHDLLIITTCLSSRFVDVPISGDFYEFQKPSKTDCSSPPISGQEDLARIVRRVFDPLQLPWKHRQPFLHDRGDALEHTRVLVHACCHHLLRKKVSLDDIARNLRFCFEGGDMRYANF